MNAKVTRGGTIFNIPLHTLRGPVAFLILAAAFIAAAIWGVWGIYNYYVPSIALAQNFSMGIAAVSLLAGTAAFFSPCAFGMLPSYFGFYMVASPREGVGRWVTPLKMGVSAALGIIVAGSVLAALVLVLGRAFALGTRIITPNPNEITQGIRIALGVGLILLGAFQLKGRAFGSWTLGNLVNRLPLVNRLRMRNLGEQTPNAVGFFFYGVAYLVASIPCTANVMVAPLLFSYATGGALGAAGTVILMVLAMGVLMILTSVVVGLAKDSVLQARSLTAHIQRASGLLVLAMGIVLIYFSLNTPLFYSTFWRFQPPGIPAPP